MTKKKTPIADLVDDVKTAAATIGEAIGVSEPTLYERIVPVPQIDSYSELPFALAEKNGKRVSAPVSSTPSAPNQPKQQAAPAKKPSISKKSAKTSAQKAGVGKATRAR